jgi:hypothetical protein
MCSAVQFLDAIWILSHIILFKLQREALISLFQCCSFFIALGNIHYDTDKEDHILDEEQIPLFVWNKLKYQKVT